MWQRLREDIQCVFERDPAARSVREVLTAYPGLHAVWLHRVSHTLWQRGLLWPARLMVLGVVWTSGGVVLVAPAAVRSLSSTSRASPSRDGGTTTRGGARTELLVIITPKVVRSDIDVREISEDLRDRMKGLLSITHGQPAPAQPA